MKKLFQIRGILQGAWTAVSNSYLVGFLQGNIYQGKGKYLCAPGLNCYACPGALGSCPIGSLQAVFGNLKYTVSFYVTGCLLLIGVILGRFVCGFLCPIGWVQELNHRIPLFQKRKSLPGHRFLKYLPYGVLLLFVIILSMLTVRQDGIGTPWFCKWICPGGTLLGGLPLLLGNSILRQAAGMLFAWKVLLLAGVLLLAIKIYRPFCKYICPLGVIYGWFHSISLVRLHICQEKCIHCGKCEQACKMGIAVEQNPNSPECVRCGDCIKACPTGAIS